MLFFADDDLRIRSAGGDDVWGSDNARGSDSGGLKKLTTRQCFSLHQILQGRASKGWGQGRKTSNMITKSKHSKIAVGNSWVIALGKTQLAIV